MGEGLQWKSRRGHNLAPDLYSNFSRIIWFFSLPGLFKLLANLVFLSNSPTASSSSLENWWNQAQRMAAVEQNPSPSRPAASCADSRLPGSDSEGCGLSHRDLGSSGPDAYFHGTSWVFGQPGSRAPLEGAPDGLHNFRQTSPLPAWGLETLFFSAWTKRNLHESQPQFPDQVASTHSHLCFFEGSRFKEEGKKILEWGETYFQTFPADLVCKRASLGPGISPEPPALPRSRGRQHLHCRGPNHLTAFAFPGLMAPQNRFSRSSPPCPGSVQASAAAGGYSSPASAGCSTGNPRSSTPSNPRRLRRPQFAALELPETTVYSITALRGTRSKFNP